MDETKIKKIEERLGLEKLLNKRQAEFESGVKTIEADLSVPPHVARMLKRTINGITTLADEVAKMMGATNEADAERIAMDATFNADGTYKNNAKDFCVDGFSQTMLAGVYRAMKRAAVSAREGEILSALSSVVDMSWVLVTTIETMAADARSDAAAHAANASHATHKNNKQRAREWYAEHRGMTKDAAAEKMAKDSIIPASFRTIRGYLTGQ